MPPKAKIASPPLVFFNPEDFFRIRERIDANHVILKLLRSIVKTALADDVVHSVTFSPRPSPAGPRGFLSFAPYLHPKPGAKEEYLRTHPGATDWEDKIEWIRIDGKQNHDDGGATQGAQLGDMCDKVFALALSYHFACKFDVKSADIYAQKAHKLLWTFFGDAQTSMLPEVVYGQYIRGCQEKSTNRPEGLLHVRALTKVSQVLPLLPAPPSPHSPHSFMHDWLSRHVNFLLHHEVGRNAQQRVNNIATYYYVALATHLVALNRQADAVQIVAPLFQDHPKGIANKISPDGSMRHELGRTQPFHYTAFELAALAYLADLHCSIVPPLSPLDPYQARQQALQKAIRYAVALGTGQTTVRLEKNVDMRQLVFVMSSASDHYPDDFSPWLGTKRDMEAAEVEAMRGWNVRGRLLWAMKEARRA